MYILNFIRGFCMALADSVPGVSGGTIAFILGFYDEFVNALNNLISSNKSGRIKSFKFLSKIGIGWIIGFILSVLFITNIFEKNIYEINSLFLGFIISSIPLIVKSERKTLSNNKRNIIFDTIEEEIITACDPDQIERIILNLLSNAMKFTSHGGNIYVDMEVNDRCNKVIIKISNDGEKINFEDRLRIFERFTQSESLLTRRAEGTGIGLTLVKSLVKLHNGEVYVNTEFEEGTQFCIELPIRKIKNFKNNNVREKSIVSKVEKFNIEFSDIYN